MSLTVSIRQRVAAVRCLRLLRRHPATTSRRSFASKDMKQVDVDDSSVQQKLGQIQMDLVRRAERQTAERAKRHEKTRGGDTKVAAVCLLIVLAIYSYTIYAMKQERFLDDFSMPDPLEEKKSK